MSKATTPTILYRWAENPLDRLPEMAAELVRRHVAVIVASGGIAVSLAAKAATATMPIVFIVAEDPVRLGLVASLARPGGNLTGINFFNSELAAKQLELLHELVPRAGRVAVILNPANATGETTLRDVETGGPRHGAANPDSPCQHRSGDRCGVRQHLHANGPTPCSSATTPSSTAGASNWSNWRRTIGCPRSFQGENIPKWAA